MCAFPADLTASGRRRCTRIGTARLGLTALNELGANRPHEAPEQPPFPAPVAGSRTRSTTGVPASAAPPPPEPPGVRGRGRDLSPGANRYGLLLRHSTHAWQVAPESLVDPMAANVRNPASAPLVRLCEGRASSSTSAT